MGGLDAAADTGKVRTVMCGSVHVISADQDAAAGPKGFLNMGYWNPIGARMEA